MVPGYPNKDPLMKSLPGRLEDEGVDLVVNGAVAIQGRHQLRHAFPRSFDLPKPGSLAGGERKRLVWSRRPVRLCRRLGAGFAPWGTQTRVSHPRRKKSPASMRRAEG